MEKILDWLYKKGGRFVKGTILLIWILALSITAMYAANTRSISSLIFEHFGSKDTEIYKKLANKFPYDRNNPQAKLFMLYRFLHIRYAENFPPIESVIDSLIQSPGWMVRTLTPPDEVADKDEWEKNVYRRLFWKIDHHLNAIAIDKSIDPRRYRVRFSEIIPNDFVKNEDEKNSNVQLPNEAVNWVLSQRELITSQKSRGSLIDTFVLLMTLGAFGSLIFLTRDYIDSPDHLEIGAYIFRPVLGIFLAVAIFVVDLAAHTVISNSDVLSVRHETLYLLAFAAGLLSEQTYRWVGDRARAALEGGSKKPKPKDAAASSGEGSNKANPVVEKTS
jgi:hypothetical protein